MVRPRRSNERDRSHRSHNLVEGKGESTEVGDNTSVPSLNPSPAEEYKQRQQAREMKVAHFERLHLRFGNLRLLIVVATLIAALVLTS